MELPFEKTVMKFWKQRSYTPVTQEETQELRLTDNLPDVGRIIACWGQVVLRGKEWRSSHIGVNGAVMVWVLYAPEDGSAPRQVESWIPFSLRADHNQEGDDGVIRAECLLCSTDARSIGPRKLMLRCRVGVMIQTLTPEQAELASPGAMPEDIQLLDRTYPMVLTREAGERSFLSEETVKLPQGLPGAERIVYCRMTPRVAEQKVLGSRAVFRGVGELHMMYQDGEEKLFSTDLEVPFAQYLDLDGDYDEGAEVSNLLCVTSLEVEPEADGIRVKCGMVSQYIVNAPTVIRCLEDAYSTRRELETVEEELLLPAWLEEQVRQVELEERISGEDVPIDAIFFPDVPEVVRQPGGVQIRVAGSFQTLTQGPGGLSSKTVRTSRTEELPTRCDTIPCTWLRGGTQLRRESGGWAVGTRMELKLASICADPMTVVTSIRAGELRQPDPDRPSIIVRPKKADESLWDIAKYCGSTVSAIQRLNKLQREPEENRLLLIPVV